MTLKDKINSKNIPEHVAIIMDGNGRWAKQHGKLRVFGHENGVTAVKKIVEAAAEIGVKNLTLYAFSTENWKRPQSEINALMNLLIKALNKELDSLNKNKIKLYAIGELDKLPSKTYNELQKAISTTESNDKMNLILALSYSSKWEIIEATKKISSKVLSGEIDINAINDKLFSSFLCTANFPDPSLLIRTSGEYRLSNFLLWQIAYAELYFTDKLWPDFGREDFFEAILDYQNRERRFGKTSEQLKQK
ncbi:MAG: isoprenyl transferase [Bacteroidota bacterium]|nr:isoprenyl transferase [Bacteroidota bacterium]